MAAAEKNPQLVSVYVRLAEVEEHHLSFGRVDSDRSESTQVQGELRGGLVRGPFCAAGAASLLPFSMGVIIPLVPYSVASGTASP